MSFKDALRNVTPDWLLDLYHRGRAILAVVRYGFPARGLTFVGITGTNGKTTTAFLTEGILRAAGYRVGLITTATVGVLGNHRPNGTKSTTPDPWILNRWLAEMRRAGCTTIVMEVTSHSLAQHRVWGITYDTVVFTNFTHDHLDYHRWKGNYLAAKLKLFAGKPRVAIANLDDPEGTTFLALPADRHYGFSVKGRSAGRTSEVSGSLTSEVKSGESATRVLGEILEATATGSRVRVTTQASELELTVPLPGEFNVQNTLASVAVGFGFDLPIQKIIAGIEGVRGVPGRMEPIDRGQPFQVIVDYAHTPDALKRVFETLKPTVKGRLIHVGGATGDRDKTKRPILGALAGQYADIVIVTDEDPGSEDPLEIINAVAAGVHRSYRSSRGPSAGITSGVTKGLSRGGGGGMKEDSQALKEGQNFFLIPDRREAIAKAIGLAKKDDCVLITGKGHEEVMVTKTGFVPFSDRKIVTELLETRSTAR